MRIINKVTEQEVKKFLCCACSFFSVRVSAHPSRLLLIVLQVFFSGFSHGQPRQSEKLVVLIMQAMRNCLSYSISVAHFISDRIGKVLIENKF